MIVPLTVVENRGNGSLAAQVKSGCSFPRFDVIS